MRDTFRSSPLFSVRRFFICFAATLVVLTTNALFLHIRPIQTTARFATELAIHTLGFYDGFTIVALFNLTETRQKNGGGSERG